MFSSQNDQRLTLKLRRM